MCAPSLDPTHLLQISGYSGNHNYVRRHRLHDKVTCCLSVDRGRCVCVWAGAGYTGVDVNGR